MKTLDDMANYVLRQITCIYNHSLIWSDNAHGVQIALLSFHLVWAVAKGRLDDYHATKEELLDEEGCGPNSFETHFRLKLSLDHDPSEAEVTDYVIRQFQRIDERLGIVLPEKYLD
jgi:hypothetical protein